MTNDELDQMRDSLIHEAKRIAKEGGFDSVQILATFVDDVDETTNSFYGGYGNSHARINLCREFVIRDEERTRAQIRKEDAPDA